MGNTHAKVIFYVQCYFSDILLIQNRLNVDAFFEKKLSYSSRKNAGKIHETQSVFFKYIFSQKKNSLCECKPTVQEKFDLIRKQSYQLKKNCKMKITPVTSAIYDNFP